ncbi:hypothetical protein ACETK8_19430 [Brevundimonas staleyi]|uniref:Uncharacterized protein n=1 Tax=Brevundimonas staleyi TaxID=74326 RepID=A0ABW0FRE1_9CAUL
MPKTVLSRSRGREAGASGLVLAAVLAFAGSPVQAGQAAQAPHLAQPPSGPYRLAYTFTSPTEVGFMDLASLERTGDVVEGWSLNLFKDPYRPDYAPVAATMHWSRMRIDCAGQTARFTRGVGMVDGAPAFDVPIEMEDTPVQDGWVLDEAYACKGEAPARPVVESLEAAIEEANAIMTSDAWDAAGS